MMTALDQIAGKKYLNLETLRRTGEAMRTPVWFVQDEQLIYIRTVAESGKVKRVRNNARVNIATREADGKLTGLWVAATGREVHGEPEIESKVDQLLDIKYGEVKRELACKAVEEGRKYTIFAIVME
jgi:uncharacterized protein